ncbi:hypothetical protein ACLM5J_12280 [Nocardioides sp. Bht2]|uniref:hypothetical protein n=1 Tax=Nocardioides sp. Bht2 TaxID=3392297 RepID=UPI0039B391E6
MSRPFHGLRAYAPALLIGPLLLGGIAAPSAHAAKGPILWPRSCHATGGVGITIDSSNVGFRLEGDCNEVKITGDNVTIDADRMQRLVIEGDNVDVTATVVTTIIVKGDRAKVRATSATRVTMNGRKQHVTLSGLLDRGVVRAKGSTLSARRYNFLTVTGNRNTLKGQRAFDVILRGNRNTVAITKVDAVKDRGKRNRVR